MAAKYVVLTSPRTGSTWLMDVLNQQADSATYGELFLPQSRIRPGVVSEDYPRFVDWKSKSLLPRRVLTFRYCDDLYDRSGSIGFKLMYGHLISYPELFWYFKTRGIYVMHLTRLNDLDSAISEALLLKTGIAHQRTGESGRAHAKIHLEPAQVIRRIRRVQRRRQLVRSLLAMLAIKHREFSYEGIIQNIQPVFDWLNIRGVPTNSRLTKTGRPHEETISNLGDIRTALIAAGFEHLLREIQPSVKLRTNKPS